MRIAMLGHKRIPSREGGIEIVVDELATRMVAAGHNVTCYNRGGHHVSGREFDGNIGKYYNGIRIKTAWTINAKGLAAVTSSFFATLAACFGKYEVVHVHAEGPAFMCGLLKLFRKKVIVTIHGLDWKRAKWGRFASWYINKGERAAVKHADEIIVLSESVKQYFMDTYNRETVYIPNGVSKPQNRAAKHIVEKYGINKDEYILFLGRLVPEKGVHYLLDAYQQMDTDIKLVIAGGTSDTSEYVMDLQNKAKNSSKIIFTGFVEGEILEELFSNARIYVLPSDVEGMPLSLLEAMSYGNACVVSDIPECKDVIGEHGVSFNKGDVASLINVLEELNNNENKIISLKKNAADFILRKYDWDEVTARTLQLYSGEAT